MGFVHVSIFADEPLFNFAPLLDMRNANNFLPVVCDLKYADSLAYLGIKQPPSYITPFLDPSQMREPTENRDPNIIAGQVAENYRQEFLGIFFEVGEFLFRNPEVHVLQAHDYILSMFNPTLQEEYAKWRQENPQDFLNFLNLKEVVSFELFRWNGAKGLWGNSGHAL